MDERLLTLYETELRHLRETAAEFGRDHPKIAGRLALDLDAKDICPDPYVERLLEGFAFLAARVHLKLDAEFPRFTQGILETVYPDYLCPIPSMAIVKFHPDEQQGALAAGYPIPRGTQLRGLLNKGDKTPCIFTTAHPVRLLPLTITEARYFTQRIPELNLPAGLNAKAAIRIRLRKTIPVPFSTIQASPLVVHLRGADELPAQIYEQIFAHKTRLLIQAPGPRGLRTIAQLPPECVRRYGFANDQALLPRSPAGFEGYRLLREYFAMPERFLFCEFTDFAPYLAEVTGEEFDLVILLEEQEPQLEGQVNLTCFDLFCTPVVNLFEKPIERTRITGRVTEYHVLPDRQNALDYEIYRLTSVTGYSETGAEQEFLPFYKANDVDADRRAFYTVNRVPRLASDVERRSGRHSLYAGTDLFLSIVDRDMAPWNPDLRQLEIKALCTNRHLPYRMTKGLGTTDFTLATGAPVRSTRIITGPKLPRPSLVLEGQNADMPRASSGRYAWRVISHLSLNYLSILDRGDNGAEALREILRLYVDPRDKEALKQIDGLRGVEHEMVSRRVENPGDKAMPITFARGLRITVKFDETAFTGQGVFVLGAVLEQFFARQVALNSFTETVITTLQRKEIMLWPPQMGRRQIL